MSSKNDGKENFFSENDLPFPKKRLLTFETLSGIFIPSCFGGYNPKDPICENFCFRARKENLAQAAQNIRNQFGGKSLIGFFKDNDKFKKSCQEEKEDANFRFKTIKKQFKKDMRQLRLLRELRDEYLRGD